MADQIERPDDALRERLARLVCGADGMVNWTKAIPAKYRDIADAILASGWLADVRAEAARKAWDEVFAAGRLTAKDRIGGEQR